MNIKKRKIRFVVNPISGTQNKKGITELIPRFVDSERYDWEITPTLYQGHAEVLAREAVSNQLSVVVAVGGDGTVNEVGRGLINSHTAMGIIPCGSGNGLARHLHIPLDMKKAIETINGGLVKSIDYGVMNDAPFFCSCGVGFDALVSFQFAHGGRRGLWTYIEKTLLEFLKYKPSTYELEIDGGKKSYKAFLITCGNASQYGNNASMTPLASMQDGLLDITILEPFTMLDIPSLVFQLFNKMINQNSRIKTFRCEHLVIRREAGGVAHFDGDPIELGSDIDIYVVHRGIRVLGPRKAYYNSMDRATGILEDVAGFNRQIINTNLEFLRNLWARNK